MLGHIICEGPTDNIIIQKILGFLIDADLEFVIPSVTQKKNRGVSAIIDKKAILFKFLHHSFKNRVDFVIICVDNDDDIIENKIPHRYTLIKAFYEEFLQKHLGEYDHKPRNLVIIPIKTIDYWIRACQLRDAGPGTLRGLENEQKMGMKEKVYGEKNVLPNGIILEAAFNDVIDQVLTKKNIQEKLIHLSSFSNFYDMIQTIKST